MFVLICPRCQHHCPTSAMQCTVDGCDTDLSSVTSTEVPDAPPSAPPASGIESDSPHPDKEIPKADTSAPTSSRAEPLQSDVRMCRCKSKLPKNEAGKVTTCKGCGGIIREPPRATTVIGEQSAANASSGPQASCPLRPERSTTARMSITLPWGEEVEFFEHLVIGRGTHPDQRFPSLPESARGRLQKDYGGVSRFHVLLTLDETGVKVSDLGSMNGTFVRGAPIPAGGELRIEPPCELMLGESCSLTIHRVKTAR